MLIYVAFGIRSKVYAVNQDLALRKQGKVKEPCCMVKFISFQKTQRGYVVVLLLKDTASRGYGRVFFYKKRPSVFEVYKRAGVRF